MADINENINTEKQRNISGLKPFLPGVSGNPKGRPKGKTIKEMVREWLEENPDDMKAFVEHFVKKNKELAWQMMEGRPQQDVAVSGDLIINIEKDVNDKYANGNTKDSIEGQPQV